MFAAKALYALYGTTSFTGWTGEHEFALLTGDEDLVVIGVERKDADTPG